MTGMPSFRTSPSAAGTLLHCCVLSGVLLGAGCSDGASAPLTPEHITTASAATQVATVGTAVAEPPAVLVTTAAGRAVPDAVVTFAVLTGGGALTEAEVRTDGDGQAVVEWQLGTQAGENTLRATAAGASVEFHATGAAAAAAGLDFIVAPSPSSRSGMPLLRQPVLQLRDVYGNDVHEAGVTVRASIATGVATIAYDVAMTSAFGRATFTQLTVSGDSGGYSLRFDARPAEAPLTAALSAITVAGPLCSGGSFDLDLQPGAFVRYTADNPAAPHCLDFRAARDVGRQYLVMFENLQRSGEYAAAFFPGPPSGADLAVSVVARQLSPVGSAPGAFQQGSIAALRVAPQSGSAQPAATWNFGGGVLREGTPPPPPGGLPTAVQRTEAAQGAMMSLRSSSPAIGDTIEVVLAGIPRLGIATMLQRAVVRHVSNDLVLAEDVRLGTTLVRETGAHNQPLSAAVLDSLATAYAEAASIQSARLFNGRHNVATEERGGRVTAVHTLMYESNIWGYTYSSGDYFAFDYWAGTDGSTRGLNQVPQRVADNLFMHEITHMRHFGLLQHATPQRTSRRGNQWLVEGFARFTERLSIGMRLLGVEDPSRISNFQLARNPAFGGSSYFIDDVPTYLSAGSQLFEGYGSSSFVFDYLADQVSLKGGDYRAALRDVLVHGGVGPDADASVARWMPGMTLGELVTRSRIALYSDDLGETVLPEWTQYLQYQLRASRPAGTNAVNDPRNAWPRIIPGQPFSSSRSILSGGAFGFIVDGTAGAADMQVMLDLTTAPNAVLSITRIR